MPTVGQYLQPTPGNKTIIQTHNHAARLYIDNFFALAPKTGWMFYVVFDINPAAITDPSWLNNRSQTEAGMLVKSVDLPKFTAKTEVLNQYNRKTVVQTYLSYDPIMIMMHDDMSNITHRLWLNYYKYYFADAATAGITQLAGGLGKTVSGAIGSAFGGSGLGGLVGGVLGGIAGNAVSGLIGDAGGAGGATGGFTPGNQYSNINNLYSPTNYGLNSPLVNSPFFRSITIYQLNRQLFTSYQLINPLVKGWEHDKLNQTDGRKTAESRMTVNYETVVYGTGRVTKDNPTGFAVFNYDNTPSPLGAGSGGSILGGALTGAADIFGSALGINGNGSNPINVLNAAVLGAGILTGSAGNAGGGTFSLFSALTGTPNNSGFQGGPAGSNLNLNLGSSSPSVVASPVSLGFTI